MRNRFTSLIFFSPSFLGTVFALFCATTASHPLVDLFFPKLPQAADLVPGHISFTYPSINGIPLDAEISRNVVYREPSIFHHLSPLTLGLIDCLAMAFCYRFMVRFAMDLTSGSFIQTNRDKQGQNISDEGLLSSAIWDCIMGFTDLDRLTRRAGRHRKRPEALFRFVVWCLFSWL